MEKTGQEEKKSMILEKGTGSSGKGQADSREAAEDHGIPGGYEPEELLPIVANLAESYTAYESTSVTVERAEQLMEAVLYCLREAEVEKWGKFTDSDMGDGKQDASARDSGCPALAEGISAGEAYREGKACVERKVKRALKLYHRILPGFDSYGNRCLGDTFLRGIPEFFRWYDVKYAPQDTILTLDYPVLRELSHYTGIDRIYAFLKCIELEQRFLRFFPKDAVRRVLAAFNEMYAEMIENVCETVFMAVAARGFLQKILPGYGSTGEAEMGRYLSGLHVEEIRKGLEQAGGFFLERAFGADSELREYLFPAIPGMAARLKNTAENGRIWQYFFWENEGKQSGL